MTRTRAMTVSRCVFTALFLMGSLGAAAQQARWVDPTKDLANLPTSGGLLTRSGDAQIIRCLPRL